MIYRDSKTGRFAKKSTWQRSKSKGGTRYKRERPKVRRKEPKPKPPKPEELREWIVSFSYKRVVKRSLDIVVTAPSEERALEKAEGFAGRNSKARSAVESDKIKISAKKGRKIGHHHPTQWRADTRV